LTYQYLFAKLEIIKENIICFDEISKWNEDI